MKVVIIGGGSAGTTCAFELRKLSKDAEITIVEKSSNLEYSPCALPYVLSGEIADFDEIFIFRKEDYQKNNINILLNSEAEGVDRKRKELILRNGKKLLYDKLVIATGSDVFIPSIKGISGVDFFSLKTIEDAKKIDKKADKNKSSAIIGAGMIGVELAYSLSSKGNEAVLLESKENILSAILDYDMSEQLKEYLEQKGIRVIENARIVEVKKKHIVLEKERIAFDNLFLCTGMKPNIKLAKECGLKIDKGVIVDEYLQTSDKNIYACGDCVESEEIATGKTVFSMLGSTAVRQAKAIAKNMAGKNEEVSPALNNTITKIGSLYVGAVGITKKRAVENGINVVSSKYESNVRAEYYSVKERIAVKLVCENDGTIIGSQMIGNAEVVGRLNLLALAVQKKLKINELAKLKTCYNPASASIFDPITVAAEICQKKLAMKVDKK